jgi:hypothetical protein
MCCRCALEPEFRAKHTGRTPRDQVEEIDEIAVDRLIHGHPVVANVAELAAAIAILDSYGLSADAIAARVHRSERHVVRYRARRRILAAA